MLCEAAAPRAPPFLGIAFRPLRASDAVELLPHLTRHPQPLSGYTLASMLAWNGSYRYRWALVGDTLLLCGEPTPGATPQLLQPLGPFPPALAREIAREGGALAEPLQITLVSRRFIEQSPHVAAQFEVGEDARSANYVYRAQDLADLAGSRYAKKRNLLAQAARLYRWTVEPLTAANVGACREVLRHDETPAEAHAAATGSCLRRQERCALEYTLTHYAMLQQRGILVRVEGAPAAFAIYEEQCPGMAVVHFERARRDLKGLYQVVNRETARVLAAEGFELVNREEDLGDEGLRQAKRSYCPVELVTAHVLTVRR